MAGIQMTGFMDSTVDTRSGTVPAGAPMDPQDHIADSGHNDSHTPGRADPSQPATSWATDTITGRMGAIGRALSGRPGYGQ